MVLKIDKDGTRIWINSKDQFHRTDGPAVEKINGYKGWYVNGVKHRTDGAACEWGDGNKRWYLNGKIYYSKKEYNKEIMKWV